MVLYVLSNPKKIGGVFQWEKYIEHCTIVYDINTNWLSGDSIYVNNYIDRDFFNNITLSKIVDNGIKLFFVLHSDLCPINKLFVNYVQYFFGIISTNKYVYEKSQKLYPNLLNIYIPNVTNFIRENISGNKNLKKIHFVGRLSPEKNLPMLLSAIRQLPNVSLCIYGEKNVKYYNYLANLCEILGVVNRVHFMGFVDGKYDLYNQASAVILPSVHEGLPYCLLEALAYSIPIIYNDISKISYHIESDINNGNIPYVYDGYTKKLNDMLYVENYTVLLKMIGYTEYTIGVQDMIALNKADENSSLRIKSLKSLILHSSPEKIIVGSKYLIPPYLANVKTSDNQYETNVTKIVGAIQKCLEL
jgi:glycosyltransferase involved in cell wall biosynthesis